MDALLLEGDHLRIGFHGTGKTPYPEDIVVPAVLRALAQHLRRDLGTQGVFWGDYCFFAGMTGEAFRLLELMGLRKAEPGRTLAEIHGHTSVARMYEYALAAAGLAGEILMPPAMPPEPELRARIVASLKDRGTPVIGLGAFGPPEPFLVTGYVDGGRVLRGWSHFQKGTEPFRLEDWYPKAGGFVIVTGTVDPSPSREVWTRAIERALPELTDTGTAASPLGTALLSRWALHLETERDFSGFTSDQWKAAQSEHGQTAGDLAERRALAASFLELAIRHLPEATEDLRDAQASFQGAHDTVYEIWEAVARTGPFDPDVRLFQAPDRRALLASLVRRLAELDLRAARQLERALRVASGRSPGPRLQADPLLDGTVELIKAAPEATAQPPWAPENIALPNALGMLRSFLGVPFTGLNEIERREAKLDYVLWMGLSGAGFGRPADRAEKANLPLVFDTLGYDYELWMSGKLAKTSGLPCRVWGWDDNLRRRIYWNLRDRRLPVLLFGCGGWPDWWLVTAARYWFVLRGYGGSLGEHYRTNAPLDDPRNPLREIRLFEGMQGKETWTVNPIARRTSARPAMEDLYERAIDWARNALREAEDKAGRHREWVGLLADDARYPSDDPDALRRERELLEGWEVGLAERRFYTARFLDLASRRLDRPRLAQAAEQFREVNRCMERVWALVGGLHGPDAHRKIADRDVRAAMAKEVLAAGRADSEAAALLE